MPKTKGQGHSNMTIDKQEGLGKILSQHINTVRVIFGKYPNLYPKTYYYIDAYAGSGYNLAENCGGSPLIFLDIIKGIDIDYYAWFVEKEENLSTELGMRVKGQLNCKVLKGDNHIIVPQIARGLPRDAYGLIYADPNGIPDFEMLSKVSQLPGLEKYDVLIRYNGVAVKRNEPQTGKNMLDLLTTINKTHWIIRKLRAGDMWQWTFLLGMNWDGLKAWSSQGFMYALTPDGITPEAIEIINELNYSKSQRRLGDV